MRFHPLFSSTLIGLALAVPVFATAFSPVACTEEAKLCPDGVTYVGREGPNCEFAACPSSFSDVPSTHPNADAIAYVKAEGIVSGYADGTYRPDNLINRAEFLKIVLEAWVASDTGDGFARGITSCFLHETKEQFFDKYGQLRDVDFNDWYAKYLCYSIRSKFVEGYPDGTFRPAANINFVEAAKIISNVFGLPLADGQDAWYENYVRAIAAHKAIPMSVTRFDQPITRGEMAEMIYRLSAGVTDKPSQTYEDLVRSDVRATAKIKDVTAEYPADWGPLVQNSSQDTEFPNDVLMFQALDERNRYPQGANELLQIFTRFYDAGVNRYEEVCVSVVDLCDSMQQSDMFKQKSDLKADATIQIAGYPAVFEERYDPSSAYILRSYSFFTATNRIDIQVGYDIGDLYIAEYDRRVKNGESPSISQLVAEDLGEDFAYPYAGLRKLYPEETKGMERFFAQVDAMIASMR